MMMNTITDQKHIMLRVEEKQVESQNFATLFFDYALPFSPGQFIMV